MIRRALLPFTVLLFLAASALADWRSVAPGVDYQEFAESGMDVYVTRVDLSNDAVRVISSRQSDRGLKVSDYAKKNKALVAMNGDYFDDRFYPVGLTIGPCGQWEGTKDRRGQRDDLYPVRGRRSGRRLGRYGCVRMAAAGEGVRAAAEAAGE